MSPRTPAKKLSVKTVASKRPVSAWNEPVSATPMNASLNLYRRLAVGFVVLVAAVLGIVLYVSMVRATIKVTPVEQTISAEVLLDVVKTPTRENEIRGTILSGQINRTQAAAPSGQGAKEVEGTARGTVTIFNTTYAEQALVVNTRLLSPEGVLFRIDKSVTVPARGEVQVAAHADVPGKSGDIGPAKFTIPGLSAALQVAIYAESKEAFTGGVSMVSAVSQEDIDRAFADLKATLEEDAKSMLRTEAGEGLLGESFTSTVVDKKSSVEPGSEAATFEVTMTLQVVGVFFDRDAAKILAERALYAKLLPGHEFLTVNEEGLQATVEKADKTAGTANVRVYLDGVSTTSLSSEALNPGRFAGMKEDDVKALLVSEGVAKDVQIDFTPAWIHTVPRLKDHIFVEIH